MPGNQLLDRTCPRPGRQPCHRDRGRHHHRQRNISGSGRNDAGGRLGKLVYLAWLVGGLLSFFGALTYAELGAMKPQAGGEYVYIRDGYGRWPAFLYAWTWFLIAKPASIATLATGFVRVLGTFSGLRVFLHPNFVSRRCRSPTGNWWRCRRQLYLAPELHRRSRRAGDFQLVFTLLKVAIILGIVVIGFSYSGGNWQNFAGNFTGAKGGMAGFMAALVAALWAYDGWNDLNMVSGEIRDPERNIPIALIFGVAAGGRPLHAGECGGAVCACRRRRSPASPAAGFRCHGCGAGRCGRGIVSAGMALSMLVAMNGTVMSGARVPFAVARDRYFFSALAEVHPRFHTPRLPSSCRRCWLSLLLLVGASFRNFFPWRFSPNGSST